MEAAGDYLLVGTLEDTLVFKKNLTSMNYDVLVSVPTSQLQISGKWLRFNQDVVELNDKNLLNLNKIVPQCPSLPSEDYTYFSLLPDGTLLHNKGIEGATFDGDGTTSAAIVGYEVRSRSRTSCNWIYEGNPTSPPNSLVTLCFNSSRHSVLCLRQNSAKIEKSHPWIHNSLRAVAWNGGDYFASINDGMLAFYLGEEKIYGGGQVGFCYSVQFITPARPGLVD